MKRYKLICVPLTLLGVVFGSTLVGCGASNEASIPAGYAESEPADESLGPSSAGMAGEEEQEDKQVELTAPPLPKL